VDTEPGSQGNLKPWVGRALQILGKGNIGVSNWERSALVQPQNPSGKDAGEFLESLVRSRRRIVERSHGHLLVELPTATFASRPARCLAWETGAASMHGASTY
jgi:hypothetical protein